MDFRIPVISLKFEFLGFGDPILRMEYQSFLLCIMLSR